VIRTFVDSGVLIAASRASAADYELALDVIRDPNRILLTSVFVRLEAHPKAAFNDFPLQRALLSEFFMNPAVEWATEIDAIVHLALSEADRHGLSAMDALHAAAALLLGADEFVTTEKRGKSIYRVDGLRVLHIREVS
jgi:predicted nucleic acid-binding protein